MSLKLYMAVYNQLNTESKTHLSHIVLQVSDQRIGGSSRQRSPRSQSVPARVRSVVVCSQLLTSTHQQHVEPGARYICFTTQCLCEYVSNKQGLFLESYNNFSLSTYLG